MIEPMEISIRRATAADAKAIALVHVQSWRESYAGLIPDEVLGGLSWRRRRRMWSGMLTGGQGRGATYVAERDRRVVGFASAGPAIDDDEDPARTATLFSIYLLQEAQGRGAGRTLQDAVLSTLATNGFRDITLWVLEGNRRARAFYEATGWGVDGASRQVFGTTEPVELPTVRYRRAIP